QDLSLATAADCTITNTLRSATFTVTKDFQPDNNALSGSVTVTCTSGTVSPSGAQPVPEATPRQFTITGYNTGATCSASEAPVPGYTSNVSACQTVPITNGQNSPCTIVNTVAD